VLVLSTIAVVMTVGVYGLVAGIVKLDDAGLFLSQRRDALQQAFGRGILWAAPYLMKTLSVLGTAAMFLVGGGIITHGIPWLHHPLEHTVAWVTHGAGMGGVVGSLSRALLIGLCGVVAGTLVLLVVGGAKKIRGTGPDTTVH